MEWSQRITTDAWLECENDNWVRWSDVEAIEVRPADRIPEYKILFVTGTGRSYCYATKDDRHKARGAVTDLIRSISGDHRQSA